MSFSGWIFEYAQRFHASYFRATEQRDADKTTMD